ncbi:MAG TPA: ADP-glyceromanno-heptose 6-epimerase [Caulobacteraceae bacterium]|nr:ADP-glyceromanno-heptose 6-epimerase [Caulobacteraceae bacterium]
MMRRLVLVTGGAGFIGSNIVARLCADGRDVVVCDWLGQADEQRWRNLAKHPIADLIAPEETFDWLARRWREVEAVVHMGAISSTTEPDADKILRNNFALSRDLFRWCADHGRRLVYASSGATYGGGERGFDDDNDPGALAALRPLNAYGWSKALFDLFAAREAGRGHAPPQWAGLKFFNVYGPNEGHKGAMKSVAAQIWPDVARGHAVRLFKSHRPDCADGGQRRDFVYVRDAADVVAWLLERGDSSGIFNLGSGRARSFKEMAEAVFAAAGRPPQIEYVDMPETLRGRYQYFTEARMERLREAGYEGQFTALEDGVGDYVRGFLSQPDPYR